MNIFDYLKDVTDSAKERIKTPITGSFTFAFILYNWRPITLLLLSTNTIENRISDIGKVYATWDTIVVPILIAIFYVVMIPFIMMWLERASGKAVDGRMEHKNTQKKKKLESDREVLRLEAINADVRSGNLEKEQLTKNNEELQNQMKLVTDQKALSDKTYQKTIKEYEDQNKRSLKLSNESDQLISANTKQIATLLKLAGLQKPFEAMTFQQHVKFVTYCDRYIFNKAESSIVMISDEELYEKLKLIESDGRFHNLTDLGNKLYTYLTVLRRE